MEAYRFKQKFWIHKSGPVRHETVTKGNTKRYHQKGTPKGITQNGTTKIASAALGHRSANLAYSDGIFRGCQKWYQTKGTTKNVTTKN